MAILYSRGHMCACTVQVMYMYYTHPVHVLYICITCIVHVLYMYHTLTAHVLFMHICTCTVHGHARYMYMYCACTVHDPAGLIFVSKERYCKKWGQRPSGLHFGDLT